MLHECCLLTYAAHAAVIRWTHGTLFLLECGVSVLWECAGQWGGSGCARACVRVPPTHEPSVCTVSSLPYVVSHAITGAFCEIARTCLCVL